MSGLGGPIVPGMRHALFFPPFGELADPGTVVGLAERAEQRGWDGVFLWDHMIRPPGDPQLLADPWILLAAIAARTSGLVLGPMITPLARRRPQKVARETVTLDRLSHGRLVLGVGLGVNSGGELERFAECTDERERGERLDEALDLLLDLWSGEEVDHHGRHFTASGVRFLPTPLERPGRSAGTGPERPQVPVWGAAVGTRHRLAPLQRAARLDGLFPVYATIDQFRWMLGVVAAARGSLEGYDVAAQVAPDADAATVEELGAAGATWIMWSCDVHTTAATLEALVERGPLGPAA